MSEPTPKEPGYSGHINCILCGQRHWIGDACKKPEPTPNQTGMPMICAHPNCKVHVTHYAGEHPNCAYCNANKAPEPTPRTDAEVSLQINCKFWVRANFARTLERELAQALAWKESATLVESEWDPQALAQTLGAKLGESTRKTIAREGPKLIAERDAALAQVAKLREVLEKIITEAESIDGATAWDGSEIARAVLAATKGDA